MLTFRGTLISKTTQKNDAGVVSNVLQFLNSRTTGKMELLQIKDTACRPCSVGSELEIEFSISVSEYKGKTYVTLKSDESQFFKVHSLDITKPQLKSGV